MCNSLTLSVRSFELNDLELFGRWLEKRHVKDFFGDPEIWIKEVSFNLTAKSDWITYFIVEMEGAPIGFFQHYDTSKAPEGVWSETPDQTGGIDYLIGEEQYLGKGLGSEIIRTIIGIIKELGSYRYLIADPDPGNISSIKALKRNGFTLLNNGLYMLDM